MASTSTPQEKSSGRRPKLTAAFVLALAASAAGCASVTGGGGSAMPTSHVTAGTATVRLADTASPKPELTGGQRWGLDGCSQMYGLEGDQVVSSTPTDLCYSPQQYVAGTFYYLYERGNTPAQWLEEIGIKADGYTYWRYSDLPWLRQTRGNAVQILVAYPNGSTAYENLSVWEANNSDSSSTMTRVYSASSTVSGLIRTAAATIPGALAPVQSQTQPPSTTQNQQIAQQQPESFQTSTTTNSAAEQEQVIEDQGQADMLKIATEPPCDDSFNGCAP